MINVLHSIAGLRKGAGTSTYLVELAATQASMPDATVHILCRRGIDDVACPDNTVFHCVDNGLYGSALIGIHRNCPLDMVNIHGLWLLSGHSAQRATRKLSIRTVLSPHGMLEPGAMAYSRWKKELALAMFQRHDLHAAEFLHATSIQEAENLRNFGLSQPIVVLPPGIVVPEVNEIRMWTEKPLRRALFLSRVHPKKNLVGLIEAWSTLRPSGWELIIAGPDENGHVQDVLKAIRNHNLSDCVRCVGAVYGIEKADLIRSASLFILPSFSENFGIVISEALAYGVPCLTTRSTPWSELESWKCGWWIDLNRQNLVAAIGDATSRSNDELMAMGRSGRRLIEENYDWVGIGTKMMSFYHWALNGGIRPSHVI